MKYGDELIMPNDDNFIVQNIQCRKELPHASIRQHAKIVKEQLDANPDLNIVSHSIRIGSLPGNHFEELETFLQQETEPPWIRESRTAAATIYQILTADDGKELVMIKLIKHFNETYEKVRHIQELEPMWKFPIRASNFLRQLQHPDDETFVLVYLMTQALRVAQVERLRRTLPDDS